MAIDYPDWQNISGLSALLSALTTAVNALNAGYGSSVAVKFRQVANVPDGAARTLVPAVSGKTATIITALCSWQSVNNEELRGYIDIGISLDNGSTYFIVVLTPESPTVPVTFGQGAQATATNQAILWTATNAAGASATDSSISITATYVQL